MSAKHTPGPWRWELNEEYKSIQLVGGKPMYDLTILQPIRCGMGSATFYIRDTAHDGLNLMHKLHERRDWITHFDGRKHHVSWCADVNYPDMRLIAAAPELLEACRQMMRWFEVEDDHSQMPEFIDRFSLCKQVEFIAASAIAKATGGAQ